MCWAISLPWLCGWAVFFYQIHSSCPVVVPYSCSLQGHPLVLSPGWQQVALLFLALTVLVGFLKSVLVTFTS